MLNETLKHIDKLQQEIASFGDFPKEVLKEINKKLRLDWNYHSNRMEGGTLTLEETRSVMSSIFTFKNKPKKDVKEMEGHDNVLLDIFKMAKGEMRLSESRIKEIHRQIIYEENPEKTNEIGEWKTVNNYIFNNKGERIDFVSHREVPERIHDLLNRVNAYLDKFFQNPNKNNVPHPIEVAANFHVDFITLHPFTDGNGRLVRILTNLILLATGYPIFIVTMDDKTVYNDLLSDIQGYGGDREQFVEFIGDLVIKTQIIMLKALKGESIEDEDDIDKKIELLRRQQVKTPEPILRSKQTIINVVNNVYLPLLSEINNIGVKFKPLFETVEWTYYYDPNAMQGLVRGNLPVVLKKMNQVAIAEDFDIYDIKLNMYLLKYNDDKAFSMEVAVRINFSKESFALDVISGKPLESGIGVTMFKELISLLDKGDTPFTDGETLNLLEEPYGFEMLESQKKDFNKQISNVILNYIEKQINRKKKI